MADDVNLPANDPALPGEDRRRHPRAPVSLEVSLRFTTVQQFLSAHAEDVSESGMFIRGWAVDPEGKPRQVGDVITLRFDAGNERIVEGTARVARIVGDPEPGLGLEFVELSAQSRKLIEMIVRIKLALG